MKKVGLRKFTGLILIVFAVFLLVFWEAKGREVILMDEVLAAKKSIPSMEILDESMFHTISVPVNAKIEGALSPKDIALLNGKICTTPISRGGQITKEIIREKTKKEIEEESFFVIKKEWIDMRSSALRAGDNIDIVTSDSLIHFGRYKIAFVKNEDDEEVTDVSGVDITINDNKANERINSTYAINHVEIVASFEEYMAIKEYAESVEIPSLILIQRGQ